MKHLLSLMLMVGFAGCGDGNSKSTKGLPPVKIPDAVAIQKIMTPEQIELGNPVTNSLGMILVPIPAGEFQMGSPDSDGVSYDDEKPLHHVQITKPFYLSVFEVTQEQYEKVMGENPSISKGKNKPVTSVSWNDAVEFCRKLSKKEGEKYRLPTEAEWEYACRAGTTTPYSFGEDLSQLPQHAWYDENSDSTTHLIGQKLPNPWGLYDMHGNVYEWCQDRYGEYGDKTIISNPLGPEEGSHRVSRGGAFLYLPKFIRSAIRFHNPPDNHGFVDGFRLAKRYKLPP